MSQQNKPGKAMSSRLLTMKFMQRGAASPNSSPSTPAEPPSKKQRLSDGSFVTTPSSTPRSDAHAVEEALAAEEHRRTEALEREAADRGETKWYLSFTEPNKPVQESPLRIVSAGFSMLDSARSAPDKSSDDEEDIPVVANGRRSFGKFNRSIENRKDNGSDSDSSSESSDHEEEDESDDPTGSKNMIARSRREAGDKARAERKAKRKAEKEDSARMAEERRKKHVKLNKLGSISTGKSTPTRTSSQKDMTCFKCGKKGHTQRDCPQSSQPRPTYR